MMDYIKGLWLDLKSSPINTIARWQDARFLWLVMAFVSLFLIFVAHTIFQNWLYMKPCEQCVYIRFAFLVMAIGGIIAAINPGNIVLKVVGYIFGFYGIIKGLIFSVKLNAIHAAAHGDDPFGVPGCSTVPNFPFGLPLDKWAPDYFKITGDCGFDYPVVPDGTVLSSMQQTLVNFYEPGWYLWPPAHFMNMAQACFLAYAVCLIALSAMAICWILRMVKEKN